MLVNKTKCSWMTLLTAAVLLVTIGSRADFSLNVSGVGDPSEGFGYDGLYLGPNFDSQYLTNDINNWNWTDMDLTISDNGDAVLSGNMTRHYNDEVWGITINLTDLEFRDENGNYVDGASYDGQITLEDVIDLSNGINPFTQMDMSGDTGWGFEWRNLEMSLDFAGNSSVTRDGWEGFAMPNIGHPLVAELHYDGANGLTFEAWYQNHQYGWYDVGDTKGHVDVPGHNVPEPAGIALLSLGLLWLACRRAR